VGNSGGKSDDQNADRSVACNDCLWSFRWEQGLNWKLDYRPFGLHSGK